MPSRCGKREYATERTDARCRSPQKIRREWFIRHVSRRTLGLSGIPHTRTCNGILTHNDTCESEHHAHGMVRLQVQRPE
jgi:hypothetical protein